MEKRKKSNIIHNKQFLRRYLQRKYKNRTSKGTKYQPPANDIKADAMEIGTKVQKMCYIP